MPVPWRTLNSSLALDSPWFRVRCDTIELPDGTVIDYYVSERPDIAVVMAITPDDDVVLVREYKHGAGAVTLELPGGLLEPGEEPRVAAARELLEETGYASPEPLVALGTVHQDTSKTTSSIHCFLAKNAARVQKPQLDANEASGGIDVELRPLSSAPDLVRSSAVAAQSSALTLLRGCMELGVPRR